VLANTTGLSLTEAVVETLGREKLNAEQVRRVVEFTNVDAFNRKYASMDPSSSRIVHIDGGPADPVQVLQSLSSTAAIQPEDRMEDYALPPQKVASALPFYESYTTPMESVRSITQLRSKLASQHAALVETAEAAQYTMKLALDEVARRVKSAGVDGASAADFYAAWHAVDGELAKVAFQHTQHLVPSTNTKVAGRSLNPAHPAVTAFAHFTKCAHAYGSSVRARQELETEMTRVDTWLEEKESQYA
jgi:hypothetical protein